MSSLPGVVDVPLEEQLEEIESAIAVQHRRIQRASPLLDYVAVDRLKKDVHKTVLDLQKRARDIRKLMAAREDLKPDGAA